MQEIQQLNVKPISTIETEWYIITGAPSAGKSSTIQRLKELKFDTVDEYSREYYEQMKAIFERRGLDFSDLRADMNIPINQQRIFEKRVEIAEGLDPKKIIFLIPRFQIHTFDLKCTKRKVCRLMKV